LRVAGEDEHQLVKHLLEVEEHSSLSGSAIYHSSYRVKSSVIRP
jgi:hypothetical protein